MLAPWKNQSFRIRSLKNDLGIGYLFLFLRVQLQESELLLALVQVSAFVSQG